MSSGTLILAILLSGATAVFVFFPLLERPEEPTRRSMLRGTARQNQALETLWTEKLRVLRAIRDLDFDYDLNKIPDSVYQNQRIYLIRLAVAITRRIDELEGEIEVQQARLEEAVAQFRHRGAAVNAEK